MFRKTKKVLVVGGSGFIGSHVMKIEDPRFEFISFDIANKAPKTKKQDIKSDFWKDEKYHAIVFLACNFDLTEKAYLDNMQMLASIDDYMRVFPKTQVIFTSSAAVYQDLYRSMKEEDAPGRAPTIYGNAKLDSEFVIAQLKNYSIFRLSNVFGKGGRGVIDLFHNGERHINGSGDQVRDFISVETVVKTIHDALEHPKKWKGIFNVSSNNGLTVNEVFKIFGKGKPLYDKKGATGANFSVLDNSKWYKKALGE